MQADDGSNPFSTRGPAAPGLHCAFPIMIGSALGEHVVVSFLPLAIARPAFWIHLPTRNVSPRSSLLVR